MHFLCPFYYGGSTNKFLRYVNKGPLDIYQYGYITYRRITATIFNVWWLKSVRNKRRLQIGRKCFGKWCHSCIIHLIWRDIAAMLSVPNVMTGVYADSTIAIHHFMPSGDWSIINLRGSLSRMPTHRKLQFASGVPTMNSVSAINVCVNNYFTFKDLGRCFMHFLWLFHNGGTTNKFLSYANKRAPGHLSIWLHHISQITFRIIELACKNTRRQWGYISKKTLWVQLFIKTLITTW